MQSVHVLATAIKDSQFVFSEYKFQLDNYEVI
jgi:hypothetical protein